MSQVLKWDSETGLLHPSKQGNGFKMLEVGSGWNQDKLDASKVSKFFFKLHYFGSPYLQDPCFSAANIFVDVGATTHGQNARKIIVPCFPSNIGRAV